MGFPLIKIHRVTAAEGLGISCGLPYRPKHVCRKSQRPACRDEGVGLAAPQVGVNVRLMVFNPSGVRGEKDYVLVNPYIVRSDQKQEEELEGCLSFRQIGSEVKVGPFS